MSPGRLGLARCALPPLCRLNELLAAVAERGFAILGDAMAEAVAVPDTRERLLRVAHAYVDCARAHPERFR
jgi:hypothetical protein